MYRQPYQPAFGYRTDSQRLEKAADQFLKERGFARDGRPQESLDYQQWRMERSFIYVPQCGTKS